LNLKQDEFLLQQLNELYEQQHQNQIEELTKAAHNVGAIVGWDLAHAAGNVRLHLHDWNVDFAAWCSYKYLNAGPGAIGGIFVHERYANDPTLPRFSGWWGHDESTRFQMDKPFKFIPGAYGFRQSNASALNCACLLASLDIFDSVGFDKIIRKQVNLTGYLELLLQDLKDEISIITPSSPQKRGCQLSLLFKKRENTKEIEEQLLLEGIVIDSRKNIIRVAPVPLYNSFQDVYQFIFLLKRFLRKNTSKI